MSKLEDRDPTAAPIAPDGAGDAPLLYERMAALGVTRTDVDRVAHGLMQELQTACAGCQDKAACKKDLASRPDDPVWKDYCPNSVTLATMNRRRVLLDALKGSHLRVVTD